MALMGSTALHTMETAAERVEGKAMPTQLNAVGSILGPRVGCRGRGTVSLGLEYNALSEWSIHRSMASMLSWGRMRKRASEAKTSGPDTTYSNEFAVPTQEGT